MSRTFPGASPKQSCLARPVTAVSAPSVRRKSTPSSRPARGFTLIEAAIAGTVLAGLSTGLFMTVRFTQQISLGKAAGQQLSEISEGVDRYMKENYKKILALDAACAAPTLQLLDAAPAAPPDTGTAPDCSLTLGSVTVANGYQPTVKDLYDLNLLSQATDTLLLPFTPNVVIDKNSHDPARARIAVWINPVRNTEASGASSGTFVQTGSMTSVPNARGAAVPLASRASADEGNYPLGALDMPPTIHGVSCYDNRNWVFFDRDNPAIVSPIYDSEEYNPVVEEDKLDYVGSGTQYCRKMQAKGDGVFGPPAGGQPGTGGGTTGTPGSSSAWSLKAVVFNTQPYYYGNPKHLPMGAVAQVGAALETLGYSGRLSALNQDKSSARIMTGLRGLTQDPNPLQSADGDAGVPGILAAVRLVAGSDTVAGGGSGDNTGLPSWDAGGNNLVNAGLIQGQQIAGDTAVVGSKKAAMSTLGRDAVLAVNGNMVMGAKSTIIASGLEAENVNSKTLNTPMAYADRLNGKLLDVENTVYIRNGSNLRLPRVKPKTECSNYADLGMTQSVMIATRSNQSIAPVLWRFLLHCVPIEPISPDIDKWRVKSVWSSAEYDAMVAKYPTSNWNWYWYNASDADSPAGLPSPKVTEASYPVEPT
ncbi:hypothetical protein SAMN05216359_11368 [Roseateles sp. YR242]|uniref:type II secretion system protein n=1 Tax=Roseateles sp. YR242 TaxID=1855305 RepID=UPI0008D8A96F|nr:hypothetical protein [Roseateles sp. YR242]SEL66522.1 hypothetical protein SAMN05216359_11368 [Roseateles sp. YR242]